MLSSKNQTKRIPPQSNSNSNSDSSTRNSWTDPDGTHSNDFHDPRHVRCQLREVIHQLIVSDCHYCDKSTASILQEAYDLSL